jgi:5-methylcytosine-specific restriction endonuclease McrA
MRKRIFIFSERLAIWEAYGRVCLYCEEPIYWRDLEIDHILPEDLQAVTQKSPCEGKRVIMGEESALKLSQRGLDARQGGAHANPEAIIRPRTYDLST